MTLVTDSDFVQMRKAMVESQLRPDSVSDQRVFMAFLDVPRHDYVPESSLALAYADAKVPIGSGRAMNPPVATARLINEANIGADDHVLVVGAGRGYAAAIMARLAGSVVALEQDQDLAQIASTQLAGMDSVELVVGHLDAGAEPQGPYDVILIDGGIEDFPSDLAKQLKPGGRVAAALITDGISRLSIGYLTGDRVSFRGFAESETARLPGFVRTHEFTF